MGLRAKQKGRGNVNVQIGDGAQLSNNVIKVSGGALHEGGLVTFHSSTQDPSDPSDAQDSYSTPSSVALALYRTLSTQFNLEELGTVCWELGIKYEDLPAQTMSGKARLLVEKAEVLGLMDSLQSIVTRERPS